MTEKAKRTEELRQKVANTMEQLYFLNRELDEAIKDEMGESVRKEVNE